MRIGVRLAGAALLALLGGPALAAAQGPPAAASAAGPRPGIWLLADADTKIYLFGTYHILPRGFEWRSPLFDDIVRRADELVVEVTENEARANMAEAMARLQLGKEAPILWRVSPGRRRALAEMVASLGLPIETFDGMQTWGVGITLAVAQVARSLAGDPAQEGGSAAPPDDQASPAPETQDGSAEAGAALEQGISGVEEVLEAEFRASDRPISGVETVAQQMGFLASMSFADQRRMLEALADAHRKGLFDRPIDIGENAWAGGNVDGIAAQSGTDASSAFYEIMLPRRNAAWTDWLAARLERPGTLLFAVGAAHLAGPDSVQTMLGARGLTVRRIQ